MQYYVYSTIKLRTFTIYQVDTTLGLTSNQARTYTLTQVYYILQPTTTQTYVDAQLALSRNKPPPTS